MPIVRISTRIKAPIERCFDLARSIDFHAASLASTRERPIAGVRSGLIGFGEEVTWRARHFGVWQTLTSRITAFDRPRHFRDSMVAGAFRRFDHDHLFHCDGIWTDMQDVFDYTSPLVVLGRVADTLFLRRYMCRLLAARGREIKLAAESGAWWVYLA